MENMVKTISPARLKDVKGKFAFLWRLLVGEVTRREFFDTDKVVAINLEKEESIAFVDRNDDLWELFRNSKGRYVVKRLRDRRAGRVG